MCLNKISKEIGSLDMLRSSEVWLAHCMIIFQKPNLLLIIAAIGYAVDKLTEGSIHLLASTAFTMAIIIWAYEEAAKGANLFRKLFGLAVLLIMGVLLFNQFQ